MTPYGILVTGPNASGKTSATMAALAPWVGDARLATVYADNSDRSAFKGTMTDMVNLLDAIWDGPAGLVVVEGTNRIATVLSRVIARGRRREWEANLTVVSADFMREAIQARCVQKGKTFRADYWTPRILDYEAQRRYRNLVADHLGGRGREWPISNGRSHQSGLPETYLGLKALYEHLRQAAQRVLGEPIITPRKNEEPDDLFQLR